MHKFALLLCIASYAPSTALAEGNYDRGKELAKSWECTHCHGLTGNERWTDRPDLAAVPMLAGQPAQFLIKALQEFAAGDRIDDSESSLMFKITQQLSDQDIEDIAVYFSSQKRY